MSLKDELLKAKVISKKEVNKIEHEQRVERKKIGAEAIKQQEIERHQEIEKKMQEQRQQNREIAKQQTQEKQGLRAEEIVKAGQIDEHGNRKFYFVARNCKIPHLSISDTMAEKIERGAVAIVEMPSTNGGLAEFYIVNRQSAERLLEIDANLVRVFNK